jgi:hypothetical protein
LAARNRHAIANAVRTRAAGYGRRRNAAGRPRSRWLCAVRIGCRAVSSRELISAFWAAMQANDWERAASYRAPECLIDWPCSGPAAAAAAWLLLSERSSATPATRLLLSCLQHLERRASSTESVELGRGALPCVVLAIRARQVQARMDGWQSPPEAKGGPGRRVRAASLSALARKFADVFAVRRLGRRVGRACGRVGRAQRG